MAKDDDLYKDEYEPAGFRWMSMAVVLLAVSGFFALAWYAYTSSETALPPKDVVIVQADPKPYRVAPKDPGGQEFAHKDKEIYGTFTTAPKAANVKPMAAPETPKRPEIVSDFAQEKPKPTKPKPLEKPLEKPAAKTGITSYVSPIPNPESGDDNSPEKQEAPAPAVAAPVEPVKEVAPEKVVEAPKKILEAPALTAAPVKAASAAFKGHSVQLGAYGSQDEAQKNWNRISSSHLDVLDGQPHRIVRADLGAKGVYYRLRVAGLQDKAAAEALCKKLAARKQACFYSGEVK